MKNLISLIICLLMTSCMANLYGQTLQKVQATEAQSIIIAEIGSTEAIGYFEKTGDKSWQSTINNQVTSYKETAKDAWSLVLAPESGDQVILNLWLQKALYGNSGVHKYAVLESRSDAVPEKYKNPVATSSKRVTSTEVSNVSADAGTVTLHNQGIYNLKVYAGQEVSKDDEIGVEVGKLLSKAPLTLENVKKGTYLSFVPFGRGDLDNVVSETMYMWNVDNQDYFVYAQETPDPRTSPQPLNINVNGIDLSTLNPRDIVAGKKGQIFEKIQGTSVDYKSVNGGDNDYIKDGFDFDPNPSGKGSNTQKMRYKSESVKNSWSINVDLSGSGKLPSGVNIDGGVGVGYSEFDERHKDQKEIYIEKSEWKQRYSISCDSSRADLDYRFKADIRKLPEVYNSSTEGAYKAFVKKYGTHYLKDVVYGGFYNSYITISENAFNSLQGNALNVKADLGVSKGGAKETTTNTDPTTKAGKLLGEKKSVKRSSSNKNGAQLAVEYNEKHEEALSEAFEDIDAGWEYGGGDGNFEGWGLTADAAAIPVIIRPRLISELIQPQVFRDDTDQDKLQKIKSNLEKYLTTYIKDNMPPKGLLDAPPIGYTLKIKEVKITDYKDEMDATKKADISIMAYSGLLSTLKANNPQISFRNGEVDKQLVREAKINPEQKVNIPLDLVSREIGLIVKDGNPDKRVFKIVGTFKEEDSNFGGTPEEWIASGYINTDLTDSNPTRNGELTLKHSAVRWGAKQQFDVIVKYELTRKADLFDIPDGAQVKQSNQSEQISTTELVNDPALNAPVQITFKHKGAYIAKYNIAYTRNGQVENINTGEVTSVTEGTYNIPSDATNVIVKAEGLTGLVWAPVTVHFQQTYPKAVSRIIESYGSTLDQSYKELDAAGRVVSQGSAPPPPSNKKKISVINKGAYNAKYTISYTLKGQPKTINSGELLGGQKKDFEIFADATNVTILAQGATGLVWQPWTTHFKQNYTKAQNRTIESHGTTLSQSYKEFDIKGALVSQGNTPPPPADTNRVTFKNRGAYTAKYTLTYMLQGRKVEESSGKILSGRDKFYDIPRVATNVFIKAEGFTGWFEETQTHYEKTFPKAVTISIESQGAARGQSAKVN